MSGWIKLHRKLLEWEWRTDPHAVAVFVYLLLRANYKQTKWQGIDILAGQIVTGRKKMAVEIGLSEQQIRTQLNNLKSTNEITIKTTNKYSIITITNWHLYQDEQPTNQPTVNQQDNQQITTSKEVNKLKKEKNIIITPVGVDIDVWSDFLELRKKKRAPITQTAIHGLEKEAAKAGVTLNEAIKICCKRGWKDFEAAWVKPEKEIYFKDGKNLMDFGGNWEAYQEYLKEKGRLTVA